MMGKWCMYIEWFQVYRVSIVLQLNASIHLYIDASTYFYILHSKQYTERFINEFGHSYHCHCVSPSSVQTFCCLDSICRQGILQDRSTSFFYGRRMDTERGGQSLVYILVSIMYLLFPLMQNNTTFSHYEYYRFWQIVKWLVVNE